MAEDRYYPDEICQECGTKYGTPRSNNHEIGMWNGTCGWCGKEGAVTAPRDYRYPDWNGTPPKSGNCCKRSSE